MDQLEKNRRESAIRAAVAYQKNGGDTTGDEWTEYRGDIARWTGGTWSADRIGFAAPPPPAPTIVESSP